MNPFTKIWFWLLVLSIIGFILGLIFFETMGQTTTGVNSTPIWIWIIFILSLVFLIVAFILYAIDLADYSRKMEIAAACGELPPPPPPKKIECPRKCVEKRVVECVERKPKKIDCPPPVKVTPCPPKRIDCPQPVTTVVANVVPAAVEPTRIVINSSEEPLYQPANIATITTDSDEAFAAASLQPLASLAPITV